MASNKNTQETIKDFIGNITDSYKLAFDEILNRAGTTSAIGGQNQSGEIGRAHV